MSDQQTLIIHNFNVLFNILHEVENILNFKIKSVSILDTEILNDKNYLIISKDTNFKIDNQINIKEYPLYLSKLIEIININFLKNKYNEQNNINIGRYYINLNSRVMNKNNEKLSLTEKEAKIIIFLNKSNKPKSINELQKNVWGHKSKLETHTVETHIYRLRKKIENKFKDNKFISSLKGGYKINA